MPDFMTPGSLSVKLKPQLLEFLDNLSVRET